MKNLKIISGGQAGVDRAALDFALNHSIDCGGWCPQGRKSEDGTIPDHYPLKETPELDYSFRTKKNIENSDATLILFINKFDDGTRLTRSLCENLNKSYLIKNLDAALGSNELPIWIKKNSIEILNIAGPRESSHKGIYSKTFSYLEQQLNFCF